MTSTEAQKAFTPKAVFFGLLGACFIAGYAGFSDNRLQQTLMISNHFPIGGYFFLITIALLWNGLFGRTRLALNPRELVVTMTMTLSACFVPTSGFLRFFQRQIMLPWYYLNGKADWQKYNTLEYLPKKLFPLGAEVDETVYQGFAQGLTKGNETLGLSELPFSAWIPPLMHWAPLVLLMVICILALSVIVHRQWSQHEQLSYPLAAVAFSLLEKKNDARRLSDIFYSRIFWIATLFVFSIYLTNYLSYWFPGYLPEIKFKFDIDGELSNKFPILSQIDKADIHKQTIFFTIIGLAYFISPQVSFSMGLTSLLYVFFGAQFYFFTGNPVNVLNMDIFRGGAYFGYALILLYTGRTYYLAVFLKAIGIGKNYAYDKNAVYAARILLAGFIGFTLMLVEIGVDGFIATLFAFTLLLLFLVFNRIVCETGIPFMEADWLPTPLLIKLIGPSAIGPGPLVQLSWIGTILAQGSRESLMPYVSTSLKVAERAKVTRSKLVGVSFLGIAVALIVGFLATTWFLYNYGALSSDEWAHKWMPTKCFDQATRLLRTLSDTGQLEASANTHGLAKLSRIIFEREVMGYLGSGFFVVLLFFFLRFRFTKFPLHPVIFLVWGVWATNQVWFSFLLGWALKLLVVKFGGGKAFEKLKPLFIGLIIGELLAAGMSILIASIYYFKTGNIPPVKLTILPI